MTSNAGSDRLAETSFDVVVVGSGAAALTAALVAAREGATVAVLEAAQALGGSTAKSSGGFWMPRNRLMAERAATDDRFLDDRDGCLAHMARLAYPDRYQRGTARHGLGQHEWDLIVNYYDNAVEAIEDLESSGDFNYMTMGSFRGDDLGMPPWFETEEDGITYGRLLATTPLDADPDEPLAIGVTRTGGSDESMAALGAEFGDGVALIRRLLHGARKYGAAVAVEHRVVDVVTDDDGAAVGVVAETPDGTVTVEARRGVVFASGGFEHNPELRRRFLRGPIVGTCGAPTNRGDFIPIAERVGASLTNTAEAWWTQLPLEPCLESFEQGELINQNYGDSTIVVNAAGERVVNEKLSYNERGKIHSLRDASGGYPNRLLIQIFDDAIVRDDTNWPARWPIPTADDIPSYILRGATLEELTAAIAARLGELADRTDGFALQSGFTATLERTIERFNRFAESGVDSDFQRGSNWPEQYFSVEFRPDPKPNFTMYPISEHGPYYAVILGASCLGTKGGPTIDTKSRVLRPDGTPISGLYGAGNCIGSPTGEAYWGGGSTLGPAIFHGYLAGKNVAREPARSLPAAVSRA
jgi:succinate dehydrogenase/fumarate reductase flavoprotein subunit